MSEAWADSGKRFFLTTPIYYLNGQPHIGHAYTSIAADVLARWKRLAGHKVFFLTGTDEHGQKVAQAAAAAGVSPQEFTDNLAADFRGMAEKIGISFDDFIRTTEGRHKAACQALWQRLADAGQIYLGHYEGWYAVRDEAFYGEDEIEERDGKKVAIASGAPVEWTREPSYFFRLSDWTDRLLAFYEANPDFMAPASTRREVTSFVKAGLQDLSISRTSFTWGVPVPGDPAHVMYVWLDALTNYITAAGYPDTSSPNWDFWPANVHIVGKEITRFHCVYWPAFLMAAGLEPPQRVFANGWLTIEGQKMSKSLGNGLDPLVLAEEFGLDPLRYYLLREVPFGNDGDFSRRAVIGRLNSELANDLGNLANRVLSLIAKNCEGRLPALTEPTEADRALLGPVEALPALVDDAISRQAFGEALERIWTVVRLGNSWIDGQKPWALRKTDADRMAAVLRSLHTALRTLATVLQPFMPETMAAMLDQLGVGQGARALSDLATPLADGTELSAPVPLFRKIEETA
ncbi:methionine--tRNA ligase [Roseomonas indoligenes]|uniref:Methionine--tRNA ligase n=1 Tax=Roseomonas indoligenes TaxID=2820811 RepID=A0A940S5I0_9PROT|nr:methionine--tRNA ligase [Pararoseomonas indoligenes]MBP0492970.1 methionine--tRNA ligase [Pararoseomonas indoligenes]